MIYFYLFKVIYTDIKIDDVFFWPINSYGLTRIKLILLNEESNISRRSIVLTLQLKL